MKYDAAAERRKRALADALKSLMQKKALSKITINDIVSECGVNRKTFYYHFEDIYALLKWMLEQDAIEVVRNYDLLMQPEDAVAFVIDYVKANRHLLNCAYDTMGRDEMRRFFHTDFFGLLYGVVCRTEKQLGLDTGENFRCFLSEFYTEALAGILITMFRDHIAYSREELQENVLLILRQAIPGALREKAAGQGGQSLPPENRSPADEKEKK